MTLTYPDGRYLYSNYDLLDRLTQTGESSFLVESDVAAESNASTSGLDLA